MIQKQTKLENYRDFRMQMEFLVASKYRKPVKTLYMIITENGMFEEETMQLVENLSDMWIVTADTGRIYIYENQPEQFDDLRNYLEKGLAAINKHKKSNVSFTLEPVNLALVAINVIYFLLVVVMNRSYYAVYDTDIMLKFGALSYDTFMKGAWYQLITSMFLHFGVTHLLNNMVLLTYAGCELEHRIGKIPYLVLYFVTGIFGNIISVCYYSYAGTNVVSAGASGAVFGVIGALFANLAVNRAETRNLTAKRLLFMAGITIYYGLTTEGVNNAAHIGGFVSGIIGGFLLSKISQYGKLK